MHILVTGGSSGIGAATVRLLRARGHEVAFTYAKNKTEDAALLFDQADKESVAHLAAHIKGSSYDGMVLNAGAVQQPKSFLKMPQDEFVAYHRDGFESAAALARAFLERATEENRAGAVVFVLSSYVFGMPPRKLSAYVTLKHSLLGLMRVLAVEYAGKNIRINAVSPSVTHTPFVAHLPEKFLEMQAEAHPMGRLAEPDDIAPAIAFLLSDEARYISGANVPVTGGQ